MTEPEMKMPDPSPEKELKPARATRVNRTGVMIQNFEDIMRVAMTAHRSRMLPKEVQTVEQAFMLIMTGLDLGLKPSAAFKYLYLTKSRRVTLTTKGGLAVVYPSGLCETYKEWIEGEGDDMKAVAFTKRKGMPDPFKGEFSVEDADKAGLLAQRQNQQGDDYDSTYQKYLKDMLAHGGDRGGHRPGRGRSGGAGPRAGPGRPGRAGGPSRGRWPGPLPRGAQ
jgi:hypothetical protein